MTIRLFWLIRVTAFALIGILALIDPPHSPAGRAIQIVAFPAVGVALLACLLLEAFPRYRTWGLPTALGVMAALEAGTSTEMPAAIAVAAAGIVPVWIFGPSMTAPSARWPDIRC